MNVYWVFWLAVLVAGFAVGEAYALAHNKTTLSRFVWNVTKAFPLLPFIAGLLAGGLAVHFWWGGAVCF